MNHRRQVMRTVVYSLTLPLLLSIALTVSSAQARTSTVQSAATFPVMAQASSRNVASSTALNVTTKTYAIEDVGPPGNSSEAYAINSMGQVAGTSANRAFVWHTNTITDLGTLGGSSAYARDINDAGQVAGSSTQSDSFWPRAFLWQPGTGMTYLGTFGAGQESIAFALNNHGQVAGESAVTVFWTSGPCLGLWALPRAFVWNGSLEQVGVLPNANNCTPTSYGYGINDNGWVVGMSTANGNQTHAFVWRRFDMLDLGTFGGRDSAASAISNNGDVVGWASYPDLPDGSSGPEHAFLWQPLGGTSDLQTLPGDSNSIAYGVNSAREVVGSSYSDQGRRAFFWRADIGMVDLNILIPRGLGWTLETARDINDTGQIVGIGTHNGQTRGFRLTPAADVSLYKISGQVLDTKGQPIANVTITDSAGHQVVTNSAGAYIIPNVLGDTYTLTPFKIGFTFSPAVRSVIVPPDAAGQTFTAVAYPISGRVTDGSNNPIANVSVSYSAGHATVTDSDGKYILPELPSGSYTITPSKGTYVFSPTVRLVNLPPEVIKQNFTARYEYELVGLEVTQGIQNWSNDVALIQDRPTFLRAHVRASNGPIGPVSAELVGTSGGVELPGSPLRPANTAGTISIQKQPDHTQINDSFLFKLPPSWENGTVELEFRGINDAVTCLDHAGNANDCKVQITFAPSPAIDVRFVGFSWTDGITRHTPGFTEYFNAFQQIWSTMPTASVNWSIAAGSSYIGQPKTTSNFEGLLNDISYLQANNCAAPCQQYYMGILKDPPTLKDKDLTIGLAYRARVGAAYIDNEYTVAHEFGHVAGRLHTRCDGGEASPGFYPYDNGYISPTTADADKTFYGFDILGKAAYPPGTGDLMSYCPSRWTSDYTYTFIKNSFIARYGLPSPSPRASRSMAQFNTQSIAADSAVLISGVISPTAARIGSIFVVPLQAPAVPSGSGTYALRFEDTQGQILATYSFEPDINSDDSTTTFALLLPWDANAARVVLLQNGQELDAGSGSAEMPTVAIVSPNGGEILDGATATLHWSASDADGDPLTYMIEYSADAGTTWQALATDWLSTTYELNLDLLPGTEQGLVRVLASDGFHTGTDQSDQVFNVARHAPHVMIEPAESLYVQGQTIFLDGSAYDIEDGLLNGNALQWRSDQAGYLGSGQSLVINAAELEEGTHTITLSARDSDGQASSTSFQIQVYLQRPELPATLAVTPSTLSFVAVQGNKPTAEQIAAIRNAGDGDLVWSATADQTWLHVASSNGKAPTNLAVTADPTGLATGTYSGTLMVTAGNIAESPQMVNVTLKVLPPTDTTAPTITPVIVGTQGSNGWYTSAITVSWNVDDSESGIATTHSCEMTMFVIDTPDTTITCSATNIAGVTGSASVTLKIDKTRPAIAITSPQGNSQIQTRLLVIAWEAHDVLSDIATSSATLDGMPVTNGQLVDLFALTPGKHTLVVSATDAAGNTTITSSSFTNTTTYAYLPYIRHGP